MIRPYGDDKIFDYFFSSVGLNEKDILEIHVLERGKEGMVYKRDYVVQMTYLDNSGNVITRTFDPNSQEDPLHSVWNQRSLGIVDNQDWKTMLSPYGDLVKDQKITNIFAFKDTRSQLSATKSQCFRGCSNLSSFQCPALRVLGSATFDGCSNLERIRIPMVTNVGDALTTFRGCGKLQEIYINNNTLKSFDNGFGVNNQIVIDYNAYIKTGKTTMKFIAPNCHQLSSDIVTNIPGSVFSAATGRLTDVYLKNLTCDIPLNAFHSTNELTNIVIDSSVNQSIDNGYGDGLIVVIDRNKKKLMGCSTGLTRIQNSEISSFIPGWWSTGTKIDIFNLTNPDVFSNECDGRILMNRARTKLYAASQTMTKKLLADELNAITTLSILDTFSLSRHNPSNGSSAACSPNLQPNDDNTLNLSNIVHVCKQAFDYSQVPFVQLDNVESMDESGLLSLRARKISVPNLTAIPSNGMAYGYYTESFNSSGQQTSQFDVYCPKVKTIGTKGFFNRSALISADFPEVTSIGTSAFYLCKNLKSLNLPKCTSIGANAFGRAGENDYSKGGNTLKELHLDKMDARTVRSKYKEWGLTKECSCFCANGYTYDEQSYNYDGTILTGNASNPGMQDGPKPAGRILRSVTLEIEFSNDGETTTHTSIFTDENQQNSNFGVTRYINSDLPDSYLAQYYGEHEAFEINLVTDSIDGFQLFYNKNISGTLEDVFIGDWIEYGGKLFRVTLEPQFETVF